LLKKQGPKNRLTFAQLVFLCRRPNARFGIRIFSLKRFTVGAFEALFWGTEPKKYDRR